MASNQEFVDYVVDQLGAAGPIDARKMFGEYGLYLEGRMFAVVCDDRLFVKPTDPGRRYVGDVVEAPPYPGAKGWFVIEERLEDRDWLGGLVRMTVDALAEPRPKKPKSPGRPRRR